MSKVNIKLNVSEVNALQFHHLRHAVLIILKNISQAESFASQNNMKHVVDCYDILYSIPTNIDVDSIEIKIRDLALRTSSSAIKQIMSKYGEVNNVKEDTWRNFFLGLHDGDRVVRPTKPIPSYLTFTCKSPQGVEYSQQTVVTYLVQIPTCQYCDQPLHHGKPGAETAKEIPPDTIKAGIQLLYAKPQPVGKPKTADRAFSKTSSTTIGPSTTKPTAITNIEVTTITENVSKPTTNTTNKESNTDEEGFTIATRKHKQQIRTSDREQHECSTNVNENAREDGPNDP
ncbi:uncharacterized protein LOC131676365 [Topomyia yanbarensis]|uniref:uncharacterized protein LOC131676365 n=1 Tax=Topomyia yanbarensis TaxID=2498891 RepID=UPI00273B8CA7|nr:uncharacterized protein LOC131676365 [Topomyia yanbarensis]